ncbi:hypothetical protein TFLX_03603 [Thermoflexales bacterium]|nr:hypothetical protein TFLX_03603 [Thermoflexales bacterium]
MSAKILDPGSPLSEADIAAAEQRIGRPIPSSYRSFLLLYNGGSPQQPVSYRIKSLTTNSVQEATVDRFLGINAQDFSDIEVFWKIYHDRIPPNFFPIARDPGGNLVCIASSGEDQGKIYFWDHEEETEEGETPNYKNVYLIADSFNDFLNSFH